MKRTSVIRVAAGVIIAAGSALLASPVQAASAKSPCNQGEIDNISTSAEDFCHAQGFDSALVTIGCSNGQITGVTVSCFNYN